MSRHRQKSTPFEASSGIGTLVLGANRPGLYIELVNKHYKSYIPPYHINRGTAEFESCPRFSCEPTRASKMRHWKQSPHQHQWYLTESKDTHCTCQQWTPRQCSILV